MDFNSPITLEKLLKHANLGVVIHRWDTSIVYANPASLRLLRLSYDQILGKDALDPDWHFIDDGNRRLHPEEYPVNKVKRLKSPLHNEIMGVIDGTNQSVTWFMVNAYFEGDAEKQEGFIVVTFNDVSEQKSFFSFEDIVKNTDDIIIVTEADNVEAPLGPRIVYVNKAFEMLTGYKEREVLGETPRILQGKQTNTDTRRRIYRALKNKEAIRETILNYSKTGHPYWLEMNIMPLCNRYGEVTHFAAIERDVTQQKFYAECLEKRNQDLKAIRDNLEQLIRQRTCELRTANRKLERLAYYDVLTDIPNRRSFQDQAKGLLSLSTRNRHIFCVGIIDVDDFKSINDTFGHVIGDQALIVIANCLTKFFRQEDVIGRVGGEEFAFAISLENEDAAIHICRRLCSGIRETPIVINNIRKINVTVSIGISIVSACDSINLQEELRKADQALYQAKQEGKNKVVQFLKNSVWL